MAETGIVVKPHVSSLNISQTIKSKDWILVQLCILNLSIEETEFHKHLTKIILIETP